MKQTAPSIILDAQQEAAVNTRRNVVVSAGAGSGKTRVLTERYISLVLNDSVNVSQILTLTFTRKATSEMFERIHHRLLQHAQNGNVRARQQLSIFDEAQISTIDSFCLSVVKDSLAMLGLPPGITTDGGNAFFHALSFLLRNSDTILGRFVRHYGIQRTIDELLLTLAHKYFRISKPMSFAEIEKKQMGWVQEQMAGVKTEIEERIHQIVQITGLRQADASVQQIIRSGKNDYPALHAELCAFNRGRLGRNEAAKELKAQLNALVHKTKKTGALDTWMRFYIVSSTQRSDITELYTLLQAFHDDILAWHRQAGVLGYQEVMELAIQALSIDTSLRKVYVDKFRYIMIDEFQDNNATQRDFLFLLADNRKPLGEGIPAPDELHPGKLFFVGDQKQSIYRFRGADVAVFKQLTMDINRQQSLSLDTNYRSSPSLVLFLNTLFAKVFVYREQYEAVFEVMRPASQQDYPSTQITPPHIQSINHAVHLAYVAPHEKTEEIASDVLAEGKWIAEQIHYLVGTGYAFHDIALLFRSSGKQQQYERMLRRAGIPYQSHSIRSLFLEAPAYDIYAFLQLLYYPHDKEAYAALLRSPFVMVSDVSLAQLLQVESIFIDPAGYTVLPIAAHDMQRIALCLKLYQRVQAMIDNEPLTEVLRVLWDESGYRYSILHKPEYHSYLEHYDYLFALALQYTDRSALEYVDYLRSQMGKTERIDELELTQTGNVVRLMTVHKAKGLEFPVVFVVDCASSTQSKTEIVSEEKDTLGITITFPPAHPEQQALNVFADHAKEEQQKHEQAELRRVLYVAATRAQKQLYFTAALPRGKTYAKNSFLSLLCNAMGIDIPLAAEFASSELPTITEIPVLSAAELLRSQRTAAPHSPKEFRTQLHALTASQIIGREVRRIEITPSEVNRLWRAAVHGREITEPAMAITEQEQVEKDGTVLGTITHTLLEQRMLAYIMPDTDMLTKESWTQMEQWKLDHLLHTHSVINTYSFSVDTEPVKKLLSESWELSESFFTSQLWKQLSGLNLKTELPFVISIRNPTELYVKGIMDLVAEDSEVVWVVDYKTNKVYDDLEIRKDYEAQMAVYQEAAKRLYGKPVKTQMFFLRQAKHIEIDLAFDTVIQTIAKRL